MNALKVKKVAINTTLRAGPNMDQFINGMTSFRLCIGMSVGKLNVSKTPKIEFYCQVPQQFRRSL